MPGKKAVASKYMPLAGKPGKGVGVAKNRKTINPPFKPTTRPGKRGK